MKNKVDWVFWIQIQKRVWFKKFWKSRGSNCLDIQFFKYHINIGMPWLPYIINNAEKLYPTEGINYLIKTNENNRKGKKFKYIKNNN